jgi:hypothetical protein
VSGSPGNVAGSHFKVFDGASEFFRVTNQCKVGIGTTAPDKQVEINSVDGNNLRLTYNDGDGSATNYVDFNVSSGGDLTIAPSGVDVTVVGNIIGRNLTSEQFSFFMS